MSKLHLIGNAHIDPVWLWRWQDGFAEILATFRSALDRMKDFPDFRFTSACAVYYEWVEKADPEMFEEIRERVREGRWSIVGGWFLQPDCNTPCGESFARHALISQRYFEEKFGVTARTGYNVDSFGHNAMLPQILKRSGMDRYVFMRPGPHEKDIKDDVFDWESPDGSRVRTFRIINCYCEKTPEAMEKVKARADETGVDLMGFYGVGNHGGGPTVRLIREIKERNIPDTVWSVPDDYFDSINDRTLPVVKDELQHHARGCYSTMTTLRKANRRCENALLAAETLSVMADHLTGRDDYPVEKLRKAWKNVLFNQFHDIMGGCAVRSAYDDAAYLHGEVMSITEQAINLALTRIARKIDTLRGETLPSTKEPANWKLWQHERLGTPILVANPHAWEVTQTVAVAPAVSRVTDPEGNDLPFQLVRGEQTNGSDKYAAAFSVTVPPLGYAVCRVWHEAKPETVFPDVLKADGRTLENDCLALELDPVTGDLCRLTDRRTGKVLIDRPAAAVLLDETDCDTWAHGRTSLGPLCGRFEGASFSLIETGPLRATLRSVTKYGGSSLIRDFTLTRGSDSVEVRLTVDFHEKHRTLKLALPTDGSAVTAAIPYGSIIRPQNTGEEPCGLWLTCGALGFTSDFACGYDSEGGMLRPTVLRSAIFNDHFGRRDEFCEYMEQGVGVFRYALFPASSNSDAYHRALAFNSPLRTLTDSFHAGTLPETNRLITGETGSAVVTALKRGEDGENIIRFFEADGIPCHVSVSPLGGQIDAGVSHHQIRTFRCDGTELDLVEKPV